MSEHSRSRTDPSDLLDRTARGHEDAGQELVEQIYDELKRRARHQRGRWHGEPSLQTTALVNETYEKLIGAEHRSWESRSHFLAVSAKAMRQVLIDRARKRVAEKRGGEDDPLSLDELQENRGREVAMTEAEGQAFVVLEEALERFEREHARAAKVVECRFFSDMTIEETAEALDIGTSTVTRDWQLAKTWLYREMQRIRNRDPGRS